MRFIDAAAFVVQDTREAGQEIFAFAFADDGGYELYYPSVYECMDVKISDSYSRFYTEDALNSLVDSGAFLKVEEAANVPYNPSGWFQPEFIDNVYTGDNRNVIKYIERMRDLVGDHFDIEVRKSEPANGTGIAGMAEIAQEAAVIDEESEKALPLPDTVFR